MTGTRLGCDHCGDERICGICVIWRRWRVNKARDKRTHLVPMRGPSASRAVDEFRATHGPSPWEKPKSVLLRYTTMSEGILARCGERWSRHGPGEGTITMQAWDVGNGARVPEGPPETPKQPCHRTTPTEPQAHIVFQTQDALDCVARDDGTSERHEDVTHVDVLLESAALLAVNKPAGMVVHPAYRNPSGTLWDAVRERQLARGESVPWLLHRLDRDTSGVVLFAKQEAARRALVRQFERHLLTKVYLAVTAGVPPTRPGQDVGEIVLPLRRDPADRRRVIVDPAGQSALTRYRVVGSAGRFALVVLTPHTGRTHQLRAHLAAVEAPIVGDATYLAPGNEACDLAPRSLLHAWHLRIRTPGTGEPCVVSAPLPADFRDVITRLGLSDALAALTALPLEALCS